MTKYIVNNTKMAFQFQNGKVLERKGVLAVEEEDLKELEEDYFYKGLKERGAILLTQNKPKSLDDAGAQIAAKDAEIKALKEKAAELEEKLAEAGAVGKETATVVDSESADVAEEPKKSKKK